MKWSLALVGSLVIAFAIYGLVVRRIKPTRVLFGMKEKARAAI